MGRTKGTYTLTSNIEPKVGAPLDARTIVKLLADLTASNTFEYPYKGMKVFVEENNKSYTLVGSDPTVSTNWIEDNSGGHTIKNSAGTAMTQRSNLQFVDLTVTDDSTNDITKVENIHVIQSESELENLPDGLYMLDDDEGTVIDGNEVGYDNTDSGLNAENVQDAIDEVVETLDDKIDISAKGVANGVAELDSTGKVPSSQLPSFVDDVIEVADYDHLPATGETGKIYVTLDTNKTYRWGGTEYVEISESLALGETSSTAYRGDRGKVAYDHSQLTSGNPHNVTKSEVGLGNVDNTSDSTKKTNFTGSIASGNTGFVTGGDAYTALSGKADKVTSATNGNLAGLNATGNPTDSGISGDMTTQSASGNPISIADLKSAQIALNPVITFEPIQAGSGTPSPVNQRPISGYDKIEVSSCGVNVWDEETRNGYYLADGSFVSSTSELCTKNKIPIIPSETYYLRIPNPTSSASAIYVCEYNKFGTFIRRVSAGSVSGGGNGIQYTASSDVYFIQIDFNTAYGGTYNHNISINYPATDTDYHAYHKTTDLSESLGQTVYFASDDVRAGDLSNLGDYADLGNLSWTYRGEIGAGIFATSSITNYSKVNVDILDAICEMYNNGGSVGGVADMNNKSTGTLCLYNGPDSTHVIYIKDTNYSDATAFTSAVSGKKIVYKKETTSHIQHTPHEIALSQGYNYISTNGTSISLAYHNGELASLSDVAQVGETVNELGEYIGANNLGHEENLLNHSSSNIYQFPNDGYIIVYSGSATSGAIDVALRTKGLGNMGGIQMRVNAGGMMQTTFVKKGMLAWTIQNTAGSSAVAVYRAVTP